MKKSGITAVAAVLFVAFSGAANAEGYKRSGTDVDVDQRVKIDQSRTIHRTDNRTINHHRTTNNVTNNVDRSATATVGDIEGSRASATVGDVAGGSASVSGVEGGTGVGEVNVGGDSLSIDHDVAASTAYAPNPGNGGDCPEGFSLGIQIIQGGISGGATGQDEVCLAHKDARYVLGVGATTGDKATQAYGLKAIDELNKDKFGDALQTVQGNLACAETVSSPLALTKPNSCQPQ